MPITFDGVNEKLKRADENIINLQSEIARFFQDCKYPILPKFGDKKLLEAIQYHKTLPIPLRFSVLAGEVVHHLRSCLDHIIWELSDDTIRQSPDHRYLEFPILETPPTLENKFTRYDRKIQGVREPAALKLIEELQPYRRVDPPDDLLFIIHSMDITDKHRELVILNPTGEIVNLPGHIAVQVMGHLYGKRGPLTTDLARQVNQYSESVPHISFKNFGRRKTQPVVGSLTQLANHVRDVVSAFADLQ
jgi:hypothetical protein